ncbi:hypothetical protein BC629DRAFT_1459916 [Irpex lacteus]|nr:hypothetical protein BC629DRAFT_1459916 [Irpex lacteus]
MIKGRRGCRWGATIFYFPLRIVALVHFACSMSLLFPPPWQPEGVSSLSFVYIYVVGTH